MNSSPLEQLLNELVEQVAARVVELQAREQAAAPAHASPWMNITSAADYLDLPRQRLYRLCAEGAIPHYKQDGRLLFHRGQLDDWMTQFRQPSDWILTANRAISP